MFDRDVSRHLFNAAHICLNPAPPRRNPHSSRKTSRNERELPVPVFGGVVTPSRSPTSCFHVSPSATIAKLHPQIFCGRHLLLPLPAAPPPPPILLPTSRVYFGLFLLCLFLDRLFPLPTQLPLVRNKSMGNLLNPSLSWGSDTDTDRTCQKKKWYFLLLTEVFEKKKTPKKK